VDNVPRNTSSLPSAMTGASEGCSAAERDDHMAPHRPEIARTGLCASVAGLRFVAPVRTMQLYER
jgi:hypothetical protein